MDGRAHGRLSSRWARGPKQAAWKARRSSPQLACTGQQTACAHLGHHLQPAVVVHELAAELRAVRALGVAHGCQLSDGLTVFLGALQARACSVCVFAHACLCRGWRGVQRWLDGASRGSAGTRVQCVCVCACVCAEVGVVCSDGCQDACLCTHVSVTCTVLWWQLRNHSCLVCLYEANLGPARQNLHQRPCLFSSAAATQPLDPLPTWAMWSETQTPCPPGRSGQRPTPLAHQGDLVKRLTPPAHQGDPVRDSPPLPNWTIWPGTHPPCPPG